MFFDGQNSAANGGNGTDDDDPENCPMTLRAPVGKFGGTSFLGRHFSGQLPEYVSKVVDWMGSVC